MEKNLAILMADLSGYSALTETHGAVAAANLIDKYMSIAEKCLVGDCKVHQQTGDEIMFVSDSSDVILATARQLATNTGNEDHFLQVHGGLHYGKVLKRGGNYFGSTVNMVARIAGKAAAGTFYCSAEFVNSVADKSLCTFKSRGTHQFKNFSLEKEVFEIGLGKIQTNRIDPVCRVQILHPENAFRNSDADQLFFCSSQCFDVYKQNNRFLHAMRHVS